jgi:hypothetical protein
MTQSRSSPAPRRGLDLALAAALVLGTLALYARTLGHDYILIDDHGYTYRNPRVMRGLTLDGFVWALGSLDFNWAPLVWISLMLETTLFGPGAGPRLAVNAALHALTSLVLFRTLLAATGERWPSFYVAALFAWHPLHVEAVAWVSSRKEVLSGLGFALSLAAYVRWTRTGSARARVALYAAALLGLLAKTVVVTLPFALLLLDWWPLRRLAFGEGQSPWAALWPRVREKLGLAVLCGVVLALNALAQAEVGAIVRLDEISLELRIANAIRSYGLYLVDTLAPSGLAPYYPFPHGLLVGVGGWLDVIASAALLAGATIFVWRQARERPWLAMGWLWYLGILVPMIGIVKLGAHARADRYTYLPHIGLFAAAAWSLAELVARRPRWRAAVAAACAASLVACAGLSFRQIGLWRSSQPLLEHTLAVTPPNPIARALLGIVFAEGGDPEAAAVHFRAALEAAPGMPLVREHFLANARQRGRLAEAQALLADLDAKRRQRAAR